MNKIQELINKLCPEGVEYKELGELEEKEMLKIGRGSIISKKDIRDMPGDFPVYSSSAIGDGEIGRYGKYMFDDERITWSIDGGGKFFYRNNLKYSVTNVSGWIKVLNTDFINTKFLYYVLINSWQKQEYNYTKKAHPSVIKKEYSIPVPPMEVQRELVRVLDKFTLYSVELSVELSAELIRRKKQYQYYIEEMFNFDNSVHRNRLIDICKIKRGKRVTKKELYKEYEYPVFQNSLAPMGNYKEYNYEKDKTYIITAGSAGEVGFCEKRFWAADDCLVISDTKNIINKYIYYFLVLNNDYIKSNVRRASIPRVSKEVIENIEIPVPSLEEQKRIVNMLEKFESLITNLSIGLPAEIEARQKQYEYYRDKLLDFKRLENK